VVTVDRVNASEVSDRPAADAECPTGGDPTADAGATAFANSVSASL
jgi:hypothetical protein